MALPLTGTDGLGAAPAPWGPAPTAVSPWGAGPAGPALCPPGCHVVYGPVANVCHGAVPQVNLIPTTSVTPIPNAVYPSFDYGAPVPLDGPPFHGMHGMHGYGGYGGYGGHAPLSFYGSGYGPWGPVAGGGTGWAPGIYGSDVTFLGQW